MTALLHSTLRDEARWLIREARASRIRSMRQFAEDEIVIPDGPFEGRRYRCSRQPYTGLFFDAVDSGLWDRINALGPTQSGKTLTASVIPLLYHLFEVGETVIYGVPDLNMANDKWMEDIRPVIERTKYAQHLPVQGAGSRGGRVKDAVRFRNGATLRFMTGGGDDKVRAAFTGRVLVITETDDFDTVGSTSSEGTKLKQLFGRTRAFSRRTGRPARIYTECTVSTAEAYTWHAHERGTGTEIHLPCPHCGQYGLPMREDLAGWREAEDENAVRRAAAFSCPVCRERWTEAERDEANARAVLVHRGQEIVAGDRGEPIISGAAPETRLLSLRWSAVHNLFVSAEDVAVDEWNAAHSPDGDAEDRVLCQFVWAIPPAPIITEVRPLNIAEAESRTSPLRRGVVPTWAEWLTVGVDVHKRHHTWVAVAWRRDARGHVVDYGDMPVAIDAQGEQRGIYTGLAELRAFLLRGFTTESGGVMTPAQAWIDASYHQDVVYLFAEESNRGADEERFRPCKGFGSGRDKTPYRPPAGVSRRVRLIGDGYYLLRLEKSRVEQANVNADYWKTWTWDRLSTPLEEPGGMTLFECAPGESHAEFLAQLTAEQPEEEWKKGVGMILRWNRKRRANHYLDATYDACAAGHYCGARLLPTPPEEAAIQAADWFGRQRTRRRRGTRHDTSAV